MLNIIKQEINLSPELRKKLNWAIKYTNIDFSLEQGTLIRLEPTNLAYVEPHKVIIGKTTLLFFNDVNIFYVNNFNEKHKLSDLQDFLKIVKTN